MKTALVVLAAAASMILTACGSSAAPAAHASSAPSCPASWQAGWTKLARQIDAPVYCPGWMPNPLDGHIGGQWNGLRSVDRRGGFLVSFIDQENGTEVHVNFHRWPGTRMPHCRAETSNRQIPCYSDAAGHVVTTHGIDATLYTVSRDADQWHLSYLWRAGGATYVVSEHVAPPYSFEQVKRNVTRVLRSLVLVPAPA